MDKTLKFQFVTYSVKSCFVLFCFKIGDTLVFGRLLTIPRDIQVCLSEIMQAFNKIPTLSFRVLLANWARRFSLC